MAKKNVFAIRDIDLTSFVLWLDHCIWLPFRLPLSNLSRHFLAVMRRRGIEWEHKGTHEERLSVLDYKKQDRGKEVIQFEGRILEKYKIIFCTKS